MKYKIVILTSLLIILQMSALIITKGYLYHDEFLVYEISKLPVKQLLQTALFEPHPPFFYLLLKLQLTDAQEILKALFLVFAVSIFTFAGAEFKGKNLHLFQRTLIIFCFSWTSLYILGSLKQDIVSLPLLFFLYYRQQKKGAPDSNKIVIDIALLTTIFFLSYVNYMWAITYFFVTKFPFAFRKLQKIHLLFLGHFLVICGYFYAYGFLQISNNLTRFGWINDYSNSPLVALSTHLTGVAQIQPYTIAPLFIFVFLAVVGIKNEWRENKKLGLYFIITSFAAYFLRFYVQPRYVVFLFFLASIYFVSGLQTVVQEKYTWILILFFPILGALGYFQSINLQSRINDTIDSDLRELSTDRIVGFISNSVPFPSTFKANYLPNENNVYTPSLFSNEQQDTTTEFSIINTLKVNRGNSVETKETISSQLRDYHLSFYYYVFVKPQTNTEQDLGEKILSALNQNCSKQNSRKNFGHYDIYQFSECQ